MSTDCSLRNLVVQINNVVHFNLCYGFTSRNPRVVELLSWNSFLPAMNKTGLIIMTLPSTVKVDTNFYELGKKQKCKSLNKILCEFVVRFRCRYAIKVLQCRKHNYHSTILFQLTKMYYLGMLV